MNILLLPIRSEYIRRILSGEKRYEYRTKLCRQSVNIMLLYETAPIKRIVGEASISGTLSLPKDILWQQTSVWAGIDHAAYERYFERYNVANAYILCNTKSYSKPVLLEMVGFHHAPQSFAYVRDYQLLDTIRRAAEE